MSFVELVTLSWDTNLWAGRFACQGATDFEVNSPEGLAGTDKLRPWEV